MDVAGEVSGITEPTDKETTSRPSQPQPQLAEQGEGKEEEEDFVIVKQPETEPHPTQCVCGEEFDDHKQLKNHKGTLTTTINVQGKSHMLTVLWRSVGKSLRHLAACGGITGQYTSTNGYITVL